MSLSEMKSDMHDRLWDAQQRWFAMRGVGRTKHEVKIAGVKEFGDQNHYMRPLIFTETSGYYTHTSKRLPLGLARARIIFTVAGPSVPACGEAREDARGG